MSPWKASGLAAFATLCLIGETTGSADAQCSAPPLAHPVCATEWSGDAGANLGRPPGSTVSYAFGINHPGQAVGYGGVASEVTYAVEWSRGRIILLGSLPGATTSVANSINKVGQAVGYSKIGVLGPYVATEWREDRVINLGGLPD
jgi:uncharacterized membrane protein